MLIADFSNSDSDTIMINGLFQWDYGQQLEIHGLNLPEAVQIHFSTKKDCGDALRIAGTTSDGITTVKIPDVLLAEQEFCNDRYIIWAFVYLNSESSGETIKRIGIHVKSRPKPEDYTDPGTDDPFSDAIEQIKQYADQAGQSASDAETAKTGAEKAYQDTVNLSLNAKEEIEQAGQEQVEAIKQAGDSFVNKNQGTENAGKALIIDDAGNVVPGKSGADFDALEKIAIKPTATGTDIVADDSADWRLLDLSAQGWTEQTVTEGKQLCDASEIVIGGLAGPDGHEFDATNLIRTGYIPASQGNYYISGLPTGFSINNSFSFNNSKEYSRTLGVLSSISMNEGEYFFRISLKKTDGSDVTESDLELIKKSIMVNKGSEALPWEPYTGGKPSPSPEYQQEIKNVGKWNEGTQKYEVNVKVTGKNLLNLQKEPDVKGLYQGWKVGNGDKGTLSIKDKGNNADISECYFGLNTDGTTSNSVTWLVDNGVIKRYHIESIEKMYACMFPPNETIIKKITERFEIQYEYGSIATEYQPYKEQLLTLTSDRPITKWDRLEKREGKWGWSYRSENVVYDGSTDENWIANESAGTNAFSIFNGNTIYNTIFCNKLKRYVGAVSQIPYGSIQEVSLLIILKIENIASVDELRSWMAENPLNIWHEISNEEWVELPQEEQDALDSLTTYYPTTVIQNSENMEMTVKYVADPENYIRKNYQEKLEQVNALNARMTDLENLIVKEN